MKSRFTSIPIVLLAIALCALSGCSEKTSTSSDKAASTSTSTDMPATANTTANTNADKAAFDDYVAYNSIERLEADGKNYKMDYYDYEDGQLVYSSSLSWDSGKLYEEYDNGTIYFYDGVLSFFRTQNDGELDFNPVVFGPDGIDNFAILDPIVIPEEELLIETTSDKQFVAVTEITDKEYIDFYLNGYDVKYEEGMGVRCKYTFDMDTKELLEHETAVFYPDGSTDIYYVEKYSYNVDFPDPLECEENKNFVAAAKAPAQCRTVKVTYGPDTDEEQTMEYSIPKGYSFYIFTDDYVADKYIDRECTKVYENSVDAVNDLELFVPLD